jgi:hypothetical protein
VHVEPVRIAEPVHVAESVRIPEPARMAEPTRAATVATTALGVLPRWFARGPRSKELWTFVLGIAVLAALAATVALVIDSIRSPAPARASLGSAVVVTVAGPSGTAIPDAVVFADGRPWCDSAPCRLEGLDPGVHLVHVAAPGFVRAAQRAVNIGSDEDRTLHFELVPEASASALATSVSIDDLPAAPAETRSSTESERPASAPPPPRAAMPAPAPPRPGILNLSSSPRASVVVDGRPLGMTPQRVRVSPGPHSVLFVHPELGRAARSVHVVPGGNHSVGVQLGE